MPDKVTVHYVGPNAEGDPRTMKVTETEADALKATGLWDTKKPSKKTTTVPEPTTKKEEVKTND